MTRSFTQLGLLVGSYTFWDEDCIDQQPQQLENLIRWVLNLPEIIINRENVYPRLGVSARGLTLIYSSLLQAKGNLASLPASLEADTKMTIEVLANLEISTAAASQYIEVPHHYQHFESHMPELAKYIKRLHSGTNAAEVHIGATARRMYVWLDSEDSDWWVRAIRKTLSDYLLLIKSEKLTQSDVERLGERLECTVFAPMDITQRLPSPDSTAEDGMPLDAQMRERAISQIDEVYKSVKGVNGVRYLYLSWNLFAFDFWEDDWRHQLVHRTMLALWASWPHDPVWAPLPPKGFYSHPLLLDEVHYLLSHLLPAVRRYFLAIKDAHHLALHRLVFEKANMTQTLYPPTFYFADPSHRLAETDKYVEDEDIHRLISTCTGYDDPHAETLSWSVLEGSMATVRGETTQRGHHKARYLLLPIDAKPSQDKEIGTDLVYIVDILTFLEYTIGLEAEDIYKKVTAVDSKRSVDSETIETVDYISRKLANLVSTLPREALRNGADEFVELQLLLGRVQYGLEKMRGEAVQIERQYDVLVNRTNEFLHEYLITSPVLNRPRLSAAVMDAYPYRSLQSLMKRVPVYTAQLAATSERLGALLLLLSTAISKEALKQQEHLNRRIQVITAIIAAVALLVALPTFFPNVNARAIFNLLGYGTFYALNTGIMSLVMLCLVLIPVLSWLSTRIWRRIATTSVTTQVHGQFSGYVRQFWNLADYTAYMYEAEKRSKAGMPPQSLALHPPPPLWFKKQWESGVDTIDSRATWILEQLWSMLEEHPPDLGRKQQNAWADNKHEALEDMMTQVRTLRHIIYVFVLRPDMIPLPRTLCILRYKSLQFLDAPTIGDDEFYKSLQPAGFTFDQVKHLQNWLSARNNQQLIKCKSVAEVAKVLKTAGIIAGNTENVESRWQGDLFQ